MWPTRSNSRELTLSALEEIAVSARSGFACMFSTSDEYEAALIDKRRAEGRYRRPNRWPTRLFWAAFLGVACTFLFAIG